MSEQTLVFGPQHHLVGTVSLPDRRHSQAPALMVLLTNAGVIPRVGPHRINVRLARALARLGVPSLRFDLSGLGDSKRPSSTLTAAAQFVADTRAAMDLAQARYGCDEFAMIGFCSGADIAHLTALEDPRLRAAVLFDPYVYPTRQAILRGVAHRLRRHGVPAVAAKLWRYAKRCLVRSAGAPAAPAGAVEGPAIFGRSRVPPRDEYGRRIRQLVDQGVHLHFIYSGGEPDWYNYEAQFRDMFGRYGFVDRVAYTYLSHADHTLTQPHAQQALIATAVQWLENEVLPRRALADRPQRPALPGPDGDRAHPAVPSSVVRRAQGPRAYFGATGPSAPSSSTGSSR